jgi:hypothetical protein
METGRGPLGERGDNWLGRSGSGYVVSQHLQGCSPRLCQLRTVRLAPMSKYWTYRSHTGDMNPVNLVVGHRQKLGLRPLLHWLAQERSWVRTCGSVNRCVVDCVGSPFSQEQWDLSKSVDASQKVATYRDRLQEEYIGRTWTAVESVRVVFVVFSPTGCISIRITATLGYE